MTQRSNGSVIWRHRVGARDLGVAVLALLASDVALCQDRPAFRSEVVLREIAVSVTDRSGRRVEGLIAEDFELREDGRIRAIAAVSTWQVAALTDLRSDSAGDATLQEARASTRDPARSRSLVILLDDMHTAPARSLAVRNAAAAFVRDHLSPRDQVAVRTTSGRSDVDTHFTTSRETCIERIGRVMGSARGDMAADFAAALAARRTLDVLSSLASSAPARGQPLVVVMFSEGIAFDIYDLKNQYTNDVLDSTRRTVERLERSNLVLYVVDPRGLATLEDGRTQRNTYEEERTRVDGVAGGVAAAMRQQAHVRSLQSVRQLAESTGGFAITDRNDLGTSFATIAAETGMYYLLAFEPGSGKGAGGEIAVRVRTRGHRVSVRRRAVAAGDGGATIERLLRTPTSGGALPLVAQALVHGHGGGVVVVEIDAEGEQGVVSANERLLVAIAGVSENGDLRILARGEILAADEPQENRPPGVRWLFESDGIDPDRLTELRVAVIADARSGGLAIPLDGLQVRDDPSLSSIVVGSLERHAMRTAGEAPSLAYLQYRPTAARAFGPLDVLIVGATVCGVDGGAALDLRLFGSEGRRRGSALERVGPPALRCSTWAARMPLGGVKAGAYALQVVERESGRALGAVGVRVQAAASGQNP